MRTSSVGTLNYSRNTDGGFRLVLDVDPGLVALYRALVPKSVRLAPQRYPPHITVVRHEVPFKLEAWGRHQGRVVEFFYSSEVDNDDRYYWLDAFSPSLEKIRVELGLDPKSLWTKPPDLDDCFHITLGNTKSS